MNRIQKNIGALLTLLIMTFGSTTHGQSNQENIQETEKALKSSLLFKCEDKQIIGINTFLKHGPWIIEFEADKDDNLHLIDRHKARFQENGTRITWVNLEIGYEILIDPKNDRDIAYVKKDAESRNIYKTKCSVLPR